MSNNPHAPAPQPFGVELTQTHDSAWVHLFGELDLATAAEAEAAIASAARRGKRLTVDLRGLDRVLALVDNPETDGSP